MPLSHLTENKNEPTTISTPSPPHTPILENSPLKVPNMPESTESKDKDECKLSIAPTLKRPYFECKSDGAENVWKRSRRRILDAIRIEKISLITCRGITMWKSIEFIESTESIESIDTSRSIFNPKR